MGCILTGKPQEAKLKNIYLIISAFNLILVYFRLAAEWADTGSNSMRTISSETSLEKVSGSHGNWRP